MFLYSLANPGYERLLKDEVAYRHPEFTPAFSAAGYLTFKGPEDRGVPTFWFSRATGTFVAKARPENLETLVSEHGAGRVVHYLDRQTQTSYGATAPEGSNVLDVVTVRPGEFWLGVRRSKPFTWRVPAGLPNLVLPSQAPSRAWLKLEEVLIWSGWTPGPGTVAVELGSAPGGATWALLQRGVLVTGVDLAPMAQACLDHPGYQHVALSVRDVRKKHLPPRIDALFCDLGLSPVEAIPQLRELCHIHPEITRLYYTLKWGEGLAMSSLVGHLESLQALGFLVRCTHLPSNRNELTVAGIRKG